MKAKPIIEALGGLTEAARKIGAPVTTVQWWRDQDRFPHWRVPQVREACAREGVDPDAVTEDAA